MSSTRMYRRIGRATAAILGGVLLGTALTTVAANAAGAPYTYPDNYKYPYQTSDIAGYGWANLPGTGTSQDPTSIGAIGTSLGGPITRGQIIQRAQNWVGDNVVYIADTNYGYENSTVGGPYRQDCSGMASMALGLTSSANTSDIAARIGTGPSDFTVISHSQLQEGDLINDSGNSDPKGGHVVIFYKWINQSAGTFDYYYTGSSSHPAIEGTDGDFTQLTLDDHAIGYYQALRYNNVTAGSGASGAGPDIYTANNTVALYKVWSDGNVWGAGQNTPGGTFSGWSQLSTSGGFVGNPSVIQAPNGEISIYARTAAGTVEGASQSTPGGAFGSWITIGGTVDLAADPTVVQLANGALAIYGVGVDGHVVGTNQTSQYGSWANWSQISASGGLVGKPAVEQASNGEISIYARTTAGTVQGASQSSPGGAFGSWITIGGTVDLAADPTVLENSSGEFALYATGTDGDVWGASQTSQYGSWSNWALM